MVRKAARWLMALVVVGLATGCGAGPGRADTITVGGANSTEHLLVGQLTVQLLRARGYDVADKTGYGQPWAVRTALEAGAVDVCWEFTGETWLSHLAHDQPVTDPTKAWDCLRAEDGARSISWVAQAGYHSTTVMWVSGSLAAANDLVTLSDLSYYTRRVNAGTRLCVPDALADAAQGLKGLARAYNLAFDASLIQRLPPRDGYRAVDEGRCDCALTPSLEEVATNGALVALQDDRGFFQASNLAVAVRSSVLALNPELGEALSQLAAQLTQEEMTALYRQVTLEGKDQAKVARAWLKEHDLWHWPTPTPAQRP